MSIFKMEYIIWFQKQSSRREKLNYELVIQDYIFEV